MQYVGDDGRIYFDSYEYSNSVQFSLGELIAGEFAKADYVEMRPTNIQWETIRILLSLYRTRSGGFCYIILAINQADIVIFRNTMYFFLCDFISETR